MPEKYQPSPINRDFTNQHIVSIDQFERPDIDILFDEAEAMKSLVEEKGGNDLLRRRELANLFYEASTRTSSSFAAAMDRLGGSVIPINDVKYSSVAKGESLQDTVRTLEQYADVTVLRHPQIGAAKEAAHVAQKPVINAGDGAGEHPTQTLLDAFTIQEKLGTLENARITLMGDLKNGRTVHSLAKLASKYSVSLNYVAPEELKMPQGYVDLLRDQGVEQSFYSRVEDVLPETDVLYVTRVQGERFLDQTEYLRLKDSYRITPKTMELAKDKMIVMHPLPRVGEIHPEVDKDPRAAYFDQMRYGMYVRMALLARVLGKSALGPDKY